MNEIVLVAAACLLMSGPGCRRNATNRTEMRAAFMTTLEMAYDAHGIDSKSVGTPYEEQATHQILLKTESAHVLASSIDKEFLQRTHPELPAAFAQLQESLKLRAQGI